MSGSARETFIQNLEKFIEKEQNWLQNTLDTVGWSLQTLSPLAKAESQRVELVSCPINSEHRMPADSLEMHLIKCENKYGSYPKIVDDNLSCPSSSHSGIGSHDLINSDQELMSDTNKNEKQNERPSTSKDLVDLLNAERDAKRRRASHRGKRVHSNKKSYSEILRELIANQMVTLTDDAAVENEDSIPMKLKNETQESQAKKTTFLGVGESYYSGNPYTRWMAIEQEEENFLKIIKNATDDKKDEKKASFNSKPSYDCGTDMKERKKNSVEVRKYQSRRDINYENKTDRRESSSYKHDKSSWSRTSDFRKDFRRERSPDYRRKRTDYSIERDCRKEVKLYPKNVSSKYSEMTAKSDETKTEAEFESTNDHSKKITPLRSDGSISAKKEECELKSEQMYENIPSSHQKRRREQSECSTDSEKRPEKKKKKKHKKDKKHKKRRRSRSS